MTKKELYTVKIIKAVKEATDAGFRVSVASDPEGNTFNTLNHEDMVFGGSQKNEIVLGVWGTIVDDTELFEEQV